MNFNATLVLRAKDGTNFLVKTSKYSYRMINEVTKDVIKHFDAKRNSAVEELRRKREDVYPVEAGVYIYQQRFIVAYQLIHTVWVLIISNNNVNPLICANIVSSTAKLLVKISKSPHVTPEKVARHYPEVYLAINQLLKVGLHGCLSAESEFSSLPHYSLMAENRAKSKSASSIKNRFMSVKKSSLGSINSVKNVDVIDNVAIGNRTLSKLEDDEYNFPFSQNIFETHKESANRNDYTLQQTTMLDDLFTLNHSVENNVLAQTGLDVLNAPYTAQNNLRDSGLDSKEIKSTQKMKIYEKPLKQPTQKELKALSSGNALHLVELWKAEFSGCKLLRAGTYGEVLGTGITKSDGVECLFRLQCPNESSLSQLITSLNGNKIAIKHPDGIFTSRLAQAPNGEAPFLSYILPSCSVSPPILLAVTVTKNKPLAHSSNLPIIDSAPSTASYVIQEEMHLKHESDLKSSDIVDSESDAEALKVIPEMTETIIGHEDGGNLTTYEATNQTEKKIKNETPVVTNVLAVNPSHDININSGAVESKLSQSEGTSSQFDLRSANKSGHEEKVANSGSNTHQIIPTNKTSPSAQSQTSEKHEDNQTDDNGDFEVIVCVHLAINPSLHGGLRRVCIDLDLPFVTGVIGTNRKAIYSNDQKRLRWTFFTLAVGEQIKLKALCKVSSKFNGENNHAKAMLHAFGAAKQSLSGIQLLSGKDKNILGLSRVTFHCEVSAVSKEPNPCKGFMQALQKFERKNILKAPLSVQ